MAISIMEVMKKYKISEVSFSLKSCQIAVNSNVSNPLRGLYFFIVFRVTAVLDNLQRLF